MIAPGKIVTITGFSGTMMVFYSATQSQWYYGIVGIKITGLLVASGVKLEDVNFSEIGSSVFRGTNPTFSYVIVLDWDASGVQDHRIAFRCGDGRLDGHLMFPSESGFSMMVKSMS